MALMPLQEAIQALLEGATGPDVLEHVALASALDRVLAVSITARLDVPPTDNSAMDGYAVRIEDAGKRLPISLRIFAGDAPDALPEGSVARIFTGASIPAGANAVVMQEDVAEDGEAVVLPQDIRSGQHIRPRGQDCAEGDLLLEAGRRLRPQDLGLLASQGFAAVPVRPTLTVALASTGSELYEPTETELPPGAIYNSNRPMLAAMLRDLGCEVLDLGVVPDNPEATRDALARGAAAADVVITSGGVSVGEADYVRDAVEALGHLNLWKVAIKPGKPFAYGAIGDTPYLGLPGNPASSYVTFALLARPFLRQLQGQEASDERWLPAIADFEVARAGTRTEFLRVVLNREGDQLVATPYANQSSGVLRSLCAGDALARINIGEIVARGQRVDVLLLDDLRS
ncbi:MAG: gephyrin-like molybdotransferase Glp [Pseudomonadota bacterium]